MKEHADVDAESERRDDASADEDGLPELSWGAEVVCEEEEVEENDGEEAFEPEACATARDGVGFETILERLREGEPYKTKAGEAENLGPNGLWEKRCHLRKRDPLWRYQPIGRTGILTLNGEV
jgi:hypothetical protein